MVRRSSVTSLTSPRDPSTAILFTTIPRPPRSLFLDVLFLNFRFLLSLSRFLYFILLLLISFLSGELVKALGSRARALFLDSLNCDLREIAYLKIIFILRKSSKRIPSLTPRTFGPRTTSPSSRAPSRSHSFPSFCYSSLLIFPILAGPRQGDVRCCCAPRETN